MDTLKLLYQSVINIKLQYGSIVRGATFKTYLSELNVKINRIIRALTSSNLYISMSSLYKKLNLTKIRRFVRRITGKIHVFIYNKKTPKSFNTRRTKRVI